MSEQRLEDAVNPPTGETELNLTEESNEGPSVIHSTGSVVSMSTVFKVFYCR